MPLGKNSFALDGKPASKGDRRREIIGKRQRRAHHVPGQQLEEVIEYSDG